MKKSKANVPAKVNSSAVVNWQTALRGAMFNAITEKDVQDIVKGLVENAKKGDAKAIRMIFDYVLGGNQGPTIRDSNVLISQEQRATGAMQGSREKLSVMADRATRGEGLFNDKDGES